MDTTTTMEWTVTHFEDGDRVAQETYPYHTPRVIRHALTALYPDYRVHYIARSTNPDAGVPEAWLVLHHVHDLGKAREHYQHPVCELTVNLY